MIPSSRRIRQDSSSGKDRRTPDNSGNAVLWICGFAPCAWRQPPPCRSGTNALPIKAQGQTERRSRGVPPGVTKPLLRPTPKWVEQRAQHRVAARWQHVRSRLSSAVCGHSGLRAIPETVLRPFGTWARGGEPAPRVPLRSTRGYMPSSPSGRITARLPDEVGTIGKSPTYLAALTS